MASRYLLIFGTSLIEATERKLEQTKLRRVVSTPLLSLFVSSDQRWRNVPNRCEGIIGNLHARSSAGIPEASSDQTAACQFDEARLLSAFWGSYISFRSDGHRLRVMRDPSGTLPCFFAVADGTLYLASDVSLIVCALGRTPAIDWDQLARLLYLNDLPEARTGLVDVSELLPGHLMEFAGGRADLQPLWSPWDHVSRDNGTDSSQLSHCVQRCVTAITSPFSSIMIGVSGGLDSSIVASCVAERHSSVRAITISTDDAHGDEAEFAQYLCDHLKLPLIREAYELRQVDIHRSSVAHLPRPGGRAQLQAYDAAVLNAARHTGTEAFLSGVGGDNVFYYTNSARPLVDRYLDHGLGFPLLVTLKDVCRLTGCTVGQAVGEALKVPRGAETCKYRWRFDGRFLHPDRLAELYEGAPVHPWLIGPPSCRPGRAAHIAMLLRAQRYVDGQDRELPLTFLQPLIAQPIMEMCLGIPSWRMVMDGRDRAVARQAFESRLPPTILDRRVKGGPDGFAHQIIRAHLAAVRDALLGGCLASRQILDVPGLEVALREESLMRGIDYVRILLLLDTEAWVRHWTARRASDAKLTLPAD